MPQQPSGALICFHNQRFVSCCISRLSWTDQRDLGASSDDPSSKRPRGRQAVRQYIRDKVLRKQGWLAGLAGIAAAPGNNVTGPSEACARGASAFGKRDQGPVL